MIRPLLRLAVPFGLAGLLNLVSLLVDRYWVSGVGTDGLAALGTAHAAWMLIMTVVLGMSAGTLAGVARATGAGQPEEAGRYVAQGLQVALILGLVVALCSLVLPEGVMALTGAEPAVALPAASYLRIHMVGLLVHAPLLVLIFSLQGAGQGRAALEVGAVYPLLNLVLDPLFIHGLGLGMPGAAWATLTANGFALGYGVWTLRGLSAHLPVTRADLTPHVRTQGRIVAVGGPRSLEHLVRNGAGFALVALVTPFGAAVVSAYTAGLAVVLVLIFPGLALGQAVASLVGQNLGAGKPERAWQTAWTGAALYAGFMAVAGAVVYWQAAALIAFFDPSAAAVAAGTSLLRTLAPAFPFIALALVLGKAFSGARRPWPSLLAASLAHVVIQIPLVATLAHTAGPQGAFLGMALAFVCHGLLAAFLFSKEARPVTRRQRSLRPALAVAALALVLVVLPGCQAVDFTEKRHFADPVMQLDEGPTETHFHQKTYYSREGSAGGIGTSAGGGCGCY